MPASEPTDRRFVHRALLRAGLLGLWLGSLGAASGQGFASGMACGLVALPLGLLESTRPGQTPASTRRVLGRAGLAWLIAAVWLLASALQAPYSAALWGEGGAQAALNAVWQGLAALGRRPADGGEVLSRWVLALLLLSLSGATLCRLAGENVRHPGRCLQLGGFALILLTAGLLSASLGVEGPGGALFLLAFHGALLLAGVLPGLAGLLALYLAVDRLETRVWGPLPPPRPAQAQALPDPCTAH